MEIPIEDVLSGRVDLSDIVEPGSERLPPVHPGEILADILEDGDLSAYALAKGLNVPLNRITAILAGKRAITADTALRLAHFFGTSAEMWMRLQASHELEVARTEHGRAIAAEVRPRVVA
ncbi:MAG: HigA family addiction module antitoxin [Geminicoccaceae bacterium]